MYNELYKAWKAEKITNIPQPLAGDFYKRMGSYVKSLGEETALIDGHTIHGRLLAKENEIATRLLDELRQLRLRKLVESAKSGFVIDPEGLTDDEKDLVKTLNDSLTSFRNGQVNIAPPASIEAETELVVVRFLQDIPEIVGVDLKIYGPYKKEDIGSLPAQNAQGLIQQGAVKLVDVSSPQQRFVANSPHQQ